MDNQTVEIRREYLSKYEHITQVKANQFGEFRSIPAGEGEEAVEKALEMLKEKAKQYIIANYERMLKVKVIRIVDSNDCLLGSYVSVHGAIFETPENEKYVKEKRTVEPLDVDYFPHYMCKSTAGSRNEAQD